MIQIHENSPLQVKTKNCQKNLPPTAVAIFPISIFELKRACKTLSTENW